MEKNLDSHIFSGMQKDVSVSKYPSQFIYDGLNIRMTAREGDTLLSITNEKGTLDTTISIQGDYLGHCLINKYLVVFSTEGVGDDYITRINLSENTPIVQELYEGNLNFSAPIDAIGSYESEVIQKIYWTDGINQPRMINIVAEELLTDWDDTKTYWVNLDYNDHSFDFVQLLNLEETIKVTKILGASGEFAPGVIQYAFTYYNKYGQESNIFYTTPLYYISYKDRGASPEDKVENAFEIEVNNVDTSFDYLRIYSIQRTSIDATPFCKRIQDVEIKSLTNNKATFIDTGLTGNTVDPTELLYKGGEIINAGTIEQKDGTLFLGNINISRTPVKKLLQDNNYYDTTTHKLKYNNASLGIALANRMIYFTLSTEGSYVYGNQLTAFKDKYKTISTPCGGFKYGDVYRCGVQFQHKSGKWSEPIWIGDKLVDDSTVKPDIIQGNKVKLPILECTIPDDISDLLKANGYKKARALVVLPSMQDRNIICQGVANSTLFTYKHRGGSSGQGNWQDKTNDLYAQSSWFFRFNNVKYNNTSTLIRDDVKIAPRYGGTIVCAHNGVQDGVPDPNDPPYTTGSNPWNPERIRNVEVQGDFDATNEFNIDFLFNTLHSPDIEFDDRISLMDLAGLTYIKVGEAECKATLSTIDIQTESPTVSNNGSGFVQQTFTSDGPWGIVSGLFYDDYIVDDGVEPDSRIAGWKTQKTSCKWMVYPWQRNGSLNNDMERPADKGNQTAILKKKIISNLRYTETDYSQVLNDDSGYDFINNPQVFNSNEIQIVKVGDKVYQGNIDTLLMPDHCDGLYFCWDGIHYSGSVYGWVLTNIPTLFSSVNWYKTFSKDFSTSDNAGIWQWDSTDSVWNFVNKINGSDHTKIIGDEYVDLVIKKGAVRMKYKSTPHIVMDCNSFYSIDKANALNVIELIKATAPTNRFGGDTEDALKENTWIPCGDPVLLGYNAGTGNATVDGSTVFQYEYGDTYFQRYDCLKTYPFTREDPNQIVEIGSFMLETRTNIDGRYDRNRGQSNNLNMSPQNFNLINPIYTQVDNFFNYKIYDDDFYTNISFPNQITWTKEKASGAEIDLWTNITLASTYDMDGSKGKIVSLNTWKNYIYCFQNKGVSNILFNSRVQIPVSDGVPIEISNNYKVDGYNYLSDGIGCNNRCFIKETSSGIYFIDSVGSHLLHLGEGLQDLSEKCNMTTWFKDNASTIKKLAFDDINHDLYVVQKGAGKALCFSEKLGQFTGLYDYGNIDLIETYSGHVFTMKSGGLWKMFEGNSYCDFFGSYQTVEGHQVYVPNNKPWSLTFISNGSSNNLTTVDKLFTNLEFRASVQGDGTLDGNDSEAFTPFLPFDSLETWNEYQHGITTLSNRSGYAAFKHHTSDGDSSLKRKFRIWRCDIPRNNAPLSANEGLPNLSRHIRKPNDRMRNPWLYLKLSKSAQGNMPKTEIHDILVTYFT